MYDILIFGTGSASDSLYEAIDSKKTSIKAFIENDTSKLGKLKNNIIIISPSEIINHQFDLIVIASQYYSEIMNQLLSLGIIQEKILPFFGDTFLYKSRLDKLCKAEWDIKEKRTNELNYWAQRKKAETVLSNRHYKYFYTTHFGLDETYYKNKIILDIGCGPRGSLEWASMAMHRIGLDPLADEYLKLGADQHKMEYICSPSENIPINNAQCDAVFSFNSLDHVENVEKTLDEIKRVTRPGGIFLLIVEVNHPPTACEPHYLKPKNIIQMLTPEFRCESLQLYKPNKKGIYSSIQIGEVFPDPENTLEIGYLSAKFNRL